MSYRPVLILYNLVEFTQEAPAQDHHAIFENAHFLYLRDMACQNNVEIRQGLSKENVIWNKKFFFLV